jgi:hypothetical protein
MVLLTVLSAREAPYPPTISVCSRNFDPVFNPSNAKERQEWEKIHGKHLQ